MNKIIIPSIYSRSDFEKNNHFINDLFSNIFFQFFSPKEHQGQCNKTKPIVSFLEDRNGGMQTKEMILY